MIKLQTLIKEETVLIMSFEFNVTKNSGVNLMEFSI